MPDPFRFFKQRQITAGQMNDFVVLQDDISLTVRSQRKSIKLLRPRLHRDSIVIKTEYLRQLHMAESPIGFMAALHAGAALKNVLCMEFHSVDHPEWLELVNPHIRIENGFAAVPDAPGLGIESLNEELIEKFHKKDTPAPWSDTSHWDGEWANDRIWS